MAREEREIGRPIRYLSTLGFSEAWLRALREAVPDLVVEQIPADDAEAIPPATWAEIDVLHTNRAVPDPARAPALRWIALDTAGIDHLHGHPVWESPVQVTTIAGISPVPLAEYVVMMVLANAHHLPALLAGQERREWPTPADRWHRYLPAPVAGTTLLILGYGQIGREIGRLARALRMNVLAVNRSGAPGPDPEVTVVATAGLADVIGQADWIVCVAPLTPDTRGLIGAEMLARVKPGAVLIDAGRGGIVDPAALLDALREGRLRGAALDVFDPEPFAPDDPLWGQPNVIITPHVAGFAPAYEQEVLALMIENLRRYEAGEPLRNLVDPARGY